MRIEISPPAQEDLDSVRRWIAQDNRPRAISFVRELAARIRSLRSGHALYPELDAVCYPGLRRPNHRGYRIFYRVSDGTMEVLHVHHGSR